MRKIKQIVIADRSGNGAIIALCDDNTLWQKNPGDNNWYPIPGIPEETPPPTSMVSMVYEINGQRYRPIRFDTLKKGDLYLSVEGTGICAAAEDDPANRQRIIVELI